MKTKINGSLKMEFQIVLDGKRKRWAIGNPNQFHSIRDECPVNNFSL